jgi:hypothetical protein
MTTGCLPLTYVLPIRVADPEGPETAAYLERLSAIVDVIVVDGSDGPVFDEHRRRWPDGITHVRPDERFADLAGKAQGVHTGMALATTDHVVVADDDVRWTDAQLRAVHELLASFDLVRPQNAFDPRPWHASWDTGRTLVNRVFGGDNGGTVALRKARFDAAGGYDGRALFENLELERTIGAVGGRVHVALDLVVVRRPPTTRHFLRQRVRQAYDELARPVRLVTQLALAPTAVVAMASGRPLAVVAIAVIAVAVAEAGRRRAGGTAVFASTAALWAPLWVAERAVTSWLALGCRVLLGGVRWGDRRMALAANSPAALAARLSPARRPAGSRPSTSPGSA